ncbi:MAG TPA: hypothetical protein VHH36_04845, partial [Candidatus Thermoplasmatota archaeon]|nr:hypothetical protein [Candidatus Thermoplasmatota archaeon]
MAQVFARPWLIAGWLQIAAAALLGVVAAAPSDLWPAYAHAAGAAVGLVLVAGGLAHGFASPFTKREPRTAIPAHAALGLLLAGDALALAHPLAATLAWAYLAWGAGCVALALHLALVLAAGAPWRGGVALFAKDQPFRVGDMAAAAAFAVATLGLALGGALLLALPRGLPNAALAALLLLHAAPFFAGVLLFLLPRNAKRALPGVTLHTAALALLVAGGAGVLVATLDPLRAAGGSARYAAASVALACALFLVAILRLPRPARPGAQLARAAPMLRASFALALLAPFALLLALLGDPSVPLLALALYAWLALGAALAG